jgi:transporter family protein
MNPITWALCAAGVWGVVPLLEKIGLSKVAPLTGLFYRCMGIVVSSLILGVFFLKPKELKSVDIGSGLLLIASGFLASFVAQIFFYNGLKQGEMSRIVPIAASYPLLTFLLGLLFLGETISMLKIAGVLLVIAGIWALKIG